MCLTVHNLFKTYGKNTVFSGLNMTLESGITMMTGPSGCGKTTLARILAGLETADAGTVQPESYTVSYLFQEHRLFPWLTVLENVRIGSGCETQTARTVLRALELGNVENQRPGALSGGMQRRVAIARTLAHPADFYLFDEPLSGLDPALRRSVCATIRSFLPQNAATLIITHDTAEVEQIADHHVSLPGGEMV